MAFLSRCFSHSYAQQEFIYLFKKYIKRALYNMGQKGRGSNTPWALCVHVADFDLCVVFYFWQSLRSIPKFTHTSQCLHLDI